MPKVMPEQLDVGFYNLQENRHAIYVHREVQVLAEHGGRTGGLDVLGLCEGVGNTLPPIKGYRKIRDLSKPGRANLAAYVRTELYASHRWVDLTKTWVRPRHPKASRHPARSILVVTLLDGTMVVVAHAPESPHGVAFMSLTAARQEHVDALIQLVAPWRRPEWAHRSAGSQKRAQARARVIVTDFNAKPEDDITKKLLTDADMEVHGKPVDMLFEREVEVTRGPKYIPALNGVPFLSDHKHAYVATIRL